jgi:hypothetical protein
MQKKNHLGTLVLSGFLFIIVVALASQGALATDEQAKVIFIVK